MKRVAPRADPDVRISRIRLFGSWVRYARRSEAGHHQRVPLEKPVHRRPGKAGALGSTAQPPSPNASGPVQETPQPPHVADTAIVPVVAAQLGVEHLLLLDQRCMP